MEHLAHYTAYRDLLFTVAYEMLGSAADAEDVVQDVWLRWSEADDAAVRDPRAYLVTITTRLSLNRLRTLSRRREDYVGPWLPEPLITGPDVAEDVILAESLSTALLLVLESLGPVERAVFVLREVFELPYAEIADAVERTPEAVRQIAHRARRHVEGRRVRSYVTAQEQQRVVERFGVAVRTGDLQPLLDVLAPDVVLVTDGGGKVKAALRPIQGVEKVLRFLTAVHYGGTTVQALPINGSPGFEVRIGGRRDAIGTVVIEGGLVRTVHVVRNPEKLARVSRIQRLRRV